MESEKGNIDATADTAAEFQGPGKPTGFENIKNSLADKLHDIAVNLDEKASDQDSQSRTAHYEKQASEWLDQSSRYAREFDYKKADASVREYVRQNPGHCLLIAGGIGLIIGAVFRRR
nr:hypothetical protein [Desulfobulbaceae bacterium]